MQELHSQNLLENSGWAHPFRTPPNRGTRPVDILDRKTKTQHPLNTKGILSHD
jgi:hypothetical protein